MIIHKARPEDSPEILSLVGQLRKSAYQEMRQPIPLQLIKPNSATYLLALLNNPQMHFLVAKKERQIIGFCMAVETPKIIEARNRLVILELIVDRKYRGRGVGSAFLKEIEKIASEKNILYVKVATGVKMKSNEFYKKNGYVHFENLYRKKVI